ncbi:MAG: P-loop domain-containing protein, partial [Verrucomicrobiales bacterium]
MMQSFDDLQAELYRIDGRSYKAYKDFQGKIYACDGPCAFTLHVDHVQGDPFASPSRLRVRVSRGAAGFPDWADLGGARRVGLETFLAKAFARECARVSSRSGSGKSGMFGIDTPGQEVIERTAIRMEDEVIEARFVCGLPAAGRRALGRNAARMLCEELPALVARALVFAALDEGGVREAVEVNEDADSLRGQLAQRSLVAFVADGSVLPRRSGVDQHPMEQEGVVRFESPGSLRVTLETPNTGPVSGMGIPEGVTLIVGGGFHGKSTLLNALERGVYNHCHSDGRERVVARGDAVKIRAEDGRSVAGVDISPFIDNLPGGTDTERFTTENASGSTSQAANIVEALEAGAGVLFVDEDIAATNFMIRDARMQELVAKEKEPITPFIDK